MAASSKPSFMDPGYAAVHAEEDQRHWWFLGRRAVLLAELARWLPSRAVRIAEIGCGSGGLLPALGRYGRVVGVEADPALREVARARGLPVLAGSLPDDLPLAPGELDAVCLLDVLEHLEDDARSLDAVHRLLAPAGLLLVTVPAYAWLWSRHDELLGHRRRYTRRRLGADLGRAGFTVERLTYFNTLLAPPIITARLVGRVIGRDAHDLARPPETLNRLLAACFGAERHWLRMARLPFGVSLLAVARRGT